MKRILSIFISFVVLLGSSFSALATGCEFSPFDLSSFGVPTFYASPAGDDVNLDGLVSSGEYALSNRVHYGNGLSFCTALTYSKIDYQGEFFESNLKHLEQELFVSYDEDYIYLAAALNSSLDSLISCWEDEYGKNYRIGFSLSLVPSSSMQQRRSVITNTYLFSAEDLSCVAVSGKRTRFDENGNGSYVGNFSFSASSKDKAYFCDGISFDSVAYKDLAVLKTDSEKGTVFECKIPLGDALQTLSENMKIDVVNLLRERKPFCGSLGFEWCSSDTAFSNGANRRVTLTSVLSANDPCPLSENGENWKAYLLEKFGVVIESLPAPLCFNGAGNTLNGAVLGESNSIAINSPSPPLQKPTSTQKPSEILPPENFEVSTEDESVFDDFPSDSDLPQKTEIVFETDKSDTSKDEDGNGAFGSILTLISGVLLAVAAIAAGLLFREREDKEKKDKKSTK